MKMMLSVEFKNSIIPIGMKNLKISMIILKRVDKIFEKTIASSSIRFNNLPSLFIRKSFYDILKIELKIFFSYQFLSY